MKDKIVKNVETDLNYEVNEVRNEFRSFKRRLSVITNIIFPGAGLVLYGKSYIKGAIIFIAYFAYNYLVFKSMHPLIKMTEYNIPAGEVLNLMTLYLPALIIKVYSTVIVALLKD